MVRRVFGDQHHVCDGACRVGMLLKGRIPEIFGKVLLTDGKADGGRFGVARERKGETDFGRRAVRPFARAPEMHGIGDPDRGRAKACRVCCGVIAFENEQRKSLLILEKDPVERAEQRGEAIASKLFGLRHGQQLDKETRKLDQVIVRAPRMLVACADGEAEPTIELCRRLEIAHRMDDVVEAAGHRRHFTAENAVGCRNMFLIEASVHRARFRRAWPAIPDRLRTYSTSLRARRAIPRRAGSGGPGFRRLPPAPSRTRPAGCRAASRARASWSRTASTERAAARSRSDKSSIHRSWSPLGAEGRGSRR